MIADPQNIFEQLQNEVAARIMTLALFQGKKLPDGSNFAVLTEDEGDPEMLFTAQLAAAGLSVVVQSPSGKFSIEGSILVAQPLVIAVSISEAMLFNRATGGTQVRLMRATFAILKVLQGYAPPALEAPIYATRLLKDRDSMPKDIDASESLVAVRVLVFEATQVRIPLSP